MDGDSRNKSEDDEKKLYGDGLLRLFHDQPARRDTIYVGVTNDLVRRVHEHRTKAVPGFTTRYNLERLVHFEALETAADAIQREKTIKHWVRAWKVNLIEEHNPDWRDLFEEIAS